MLAAVRRMLDSPGRIRFDPDATGLSARHCPPNQPLSLGLLRGMLPTSARTAPGHVVGKARKKLAADPDPAETPLYTVWDVARYLGLPTWAIPAVTGHGPLDPEWFFHHLYRRWPRYPFDDEFPLPPDAPPRLNFRRLAEVFVRGFAVQAVYEAARDAGTKPGRRDRIDERAWRALDLRAGDVDVFGGVAVDHLVERHAVDSAGVDAERLRKLLLIRLDRVELRDGTPQRLFPFSRDPSEDSPRVVVLDPRIRFGRPTLAGRGVPTDTLIERFRAGDSATELAVDFDAPLAEIEEAIRYESLSAISVPFFPFAGW